MGPSVHRGHTLREPEQAHKAPVEVEERDCVIVGGGVAGLSAAWALRRTGIDDFVVLELEPTLGGTSTWQETPMRAPWGAHYVPAPAEENVALLELLNEAGAIERPATTNGGRTEFKETVLCRDPEERIFVHDRWYEGLFPRAGARPGDLGELARFDEIVRSYATRRDHLGRPAFALPRRLSSTDPDLLALDTMSAEAWLRAQNFNSERLKWWVEYACRDDFGALLGQTSAWAAMHYFTSRFRIEDNETASLLTWPEGNGHLIQAMAKPIGTRARTGCLVQSVMQTETGVLVSGIDKSGAPFSIRAKTAVCALPRPIAAHVVEARAPKRTPLDASEFVYGSWLVANLTLNDRPVDRGFPLSWDNVIYGSPSLGYVVSTHQEGKDRGATTLTYYHPFTDDNVRATRSTLLARSWEEWVDLILRDLKRPHPDIEGLVERVDVMVWGHAMVRPRPGFMWGKALREASQSIGRIHFAHTDLSGLALFEEAQDWGIRAARLVAQDLKHPFRPWARNA